MSVETQNAVKFELEAGVSQRHPDESDEKINVTDSDLEKVTK